MILKQNTTRLEEWTCCRSTESVAAWPDCSMYARSGLQAGDNHACKNSTAATTTLPIACLLDSPKVRVVANSSPAV